MSCDATHRTLKNTKYEENVKVSRTDPREFKETERLEGCRIICDYEADLA